MNRTGMYLDGLVCMSIDSKCINCASIDLNSRPE